jgi:glyoxylase I family protein
MPTFTRVDHISFSVRDADKTARWWQEVFGLDPIMTITDEGWRAVLLWLEGDRAIEFQQHDANGGETFDPVRTGFDHMGLGVASRAELDEWQAHFERLGVEHTPVVERHYGSLFTAVLTFKDPDRIQFEMIYLEGEPGA